MDNSLFVAFCTLLMSMFMLSSGVSVAADAKRARSSLRLRRSQFAPIGAYSRARFPRKRMADQIVRRTLSRSLVRLPKSGAVKPTRTGCRQAWKYLSARCCPAHQLGGHVSPFEYVPIFCPQIRIFSPVEAPALKRCSMAAIQNDSAYSCLDMPGKKDPG